MKYVPIRPCPLIYLCACEQATAKHVTALGMFAHSLYVLARVQEFDGVDALIHLHRAQERGELPYLVAKAVEDCGTEIASQIVACQYKSLCTKAE